MYSMGVELIALLMMTANQEYLEKKTKKMFATRGELAYIRKEELLLIEKVKESITEEEYFTLLELFRFKNEREGSFGIGLWGYLFEAEGSSSKEFLEWVEGLDNQKYFKYYFYGNTFEKVEEDITKENILDILDKFKVKKSLKGDILENFYFIEDKLKRLKEIVKLIYDEVFSKVEEEIEGKLKIIVDRIKKKIDKDGIEALEIPNMVLGSKLYISYNFILSLMCLDSITVVGHRLLEAGNKDRFGLGNSLDILKIIGDETRLTIIELLKKKKLYAKEIVDELKLAKSTVSYHMETLMVLGIVEHEKIENKVYYILNIKKYDRLLTELKEKLLKIE